MLYYKVYNMMMTRPKKPFEYVRTVADAEKAAERREKKEQALRQQRLEADTSIRIERAQPAANVLKDCGSLGVVALKKASIDYLLDGIDNIIGEERLLRMDAFGSVQGKDMGSEHADRRLRLMAHHRDEYGSEGILAFLGFKFSDRESPGTPLVREYVMAIMQRHYEHRGRSSAPSILLIGDGGIEDVGFIDPRHKNDEQNPLTAFLPVHFGLDAHNELSSAPDLDSRFNTAPPLDRHTLEALGYIKSDSVSPG